MRYLLNVYDILQMRDNVKTLYETLRNPSLPLLEMQVGYVCHIAQGERFLSNGKE